MSERNSIVTGQCTIEAPFKLEKTMNEKEEFENLGVNRSRKKKRVLENGLNVRIDVVDPMFVIHYFRLLFVPSGRVECVLDLMAFDEKHYNSKRKKATIYEAYTHI